MMIFGICKNNKDSVIEGSNIMSLGIERHGADSAEVAESYSALQREIELRKAVAWANAKGIIAHFLEYASGTEAAFCRYFMLGLTEHEELKDAIFKQLSDMRQTAEAEGLEYSFTVPGADSFSREPQQFMQIGSVALTHRSNFYEDGVPYDLYIEAKRLDVPGQPEANAFGSIAAAGRYLLAATFPH